MRRRRRSCSPASCTAAPSPESRSTRTPSSPSTRRRGSSPAAARSSRMRSTLSASTSPARTPSTSAPRPAASPTASSSAARRACVALDVGYGQLHPKLRNDPRVTVLERTNARALTELPFAPDLVTCDVSFISVRTALPPALGLAATGWRALVLVKPQFEAGRAEARKGVVRDRRRPPPRAARGRRRGARVGSTRRRGRRLRAARPQGQPRVLPLPRPGRRPFPPR